MKKFRTAWILGLIFVLVGFSVTGLWAAEDHLGLIKKRGKIVVGTSADYPPFESVDKEETKAAALTPISLKRLEWEHIQRVLEEHDGNISATARTLGMHRRTLQRKLQKRPVKK